MTLAFFLLGLGFFGLALVHGSLRYLGLAVCLLAGAALADGKPSPSGPFAQLSATLEHAGQEARR